MDYLVKPVQKEALLELIRKAKSSLAVTEQNAENERRMQEMQLKQYIIALLRGIGVITMFQWQKQKIDRSKNVRSIDYFIQLYLPYRSSHIPQ